MTNVGKEISKMLSCKERFLPKRSPKWPKSTEPNGRIKNPIAKTRKVESKAFSGFCCEKKLCAITGDKNTYKVKSYHSIMLPMMAAIILDFCIGHASRNNYD